MITCKKYTVRLPRSVFRVLYILLPVVMSTFATSLSAEEVRDRAYWEQVKKESEGIYERAVVCHNIKIELNVHSSRAMRSMWKRSYFKGGYLSISQVMEVETRIRHAAEYGYKQINKTMHYNAPVNVCAAKRDEAIAHINEIVSVYP